MHSQHAHTLIYDLCICSAVCAQQETIISGNIMHSNFEDRWMLECIQKLGLDSGRAYADSQLCSTEKNT